jgi:tetratricopeptide (TPR) repeat protein
MACRPALCETSGPYLEDSVDYIESEALLDVPVQARSLRSLAPREKRRFREARQALADGGGVRSLALADIPLTGLGLFEALFAQSWAVRFADPEQMVRLAQAAVEVVQHLDSRGRDPRRLADVKARAWGELGNAYRAADRLQSAREAFGRAYRFMQAGTGDPYLRARLFEIEGSLLGAWRDFPLALPRLRSMANAYLDLQETHLAGRALIILALYTFYGGSAEEAVQLNEEGIRLIDREHDPALFLFSLHNHLLFLVDLKLYPQAKKLLFKNRRNLIYKDRINALRLRIIEGKIAYGLCQTVSAEIAFREARNGMADAGMSFHTAITTLELAMALMKLGREEEAEMEVIAAREIFLSLEVYGEYLGSVLFLEETFRRSEATAEMIEATVAHIWRKALLARPQRLR